MLVSRYIALLLTQLGVKHVFGITGTTVNMCFVGLGEQEGIDYICPLHEQAASMGADGYSRVSNSIGVALSTCGPGATNMITGCVGAFTDSIPVLYIVGQVGAKSSKRDIPIRFFGFQEVDTVSIFEPITKYVKLVAEQLNIKYEIEKAMHIATSDRKGPVVLVIPENVLYADVDPNMLKSYVVNSAKECNNSIIDNSIIEKCYDKIMLSKRPIILYGAGVHSANAESEAISLVNKLKCPVAMTYPARDLFDDVNIYNVGSVGIFGSRAGNEALQNADFILGIGTRFDRYVTGNPSEFANNARKYAVDVDINELDKMSSIGLDFTEKILCDARVFIQKLLTTHEKINSTNNEHKKWVSQINKWRTAYPLCKQEYFNESTVNPYVFIDGLSDMLANNDIIFSDTGLSTVWIGQSFKFKQGQRWFTQFSNSSMGYSLPAAIGASFATENRIICITGDGGLQMSIQELSTLIFNKCNIKIFVICNEGYGLIQKTQDDYNNGHYATDRENHVPLPNSEIVAEAFGVKTFSIEANHCIARKIREVLSYNGPAFCSVHIPIEKKIIPRIKGDDKLDRMFPYIGE